MRVRSRWNQKNKEHGVEEVASAVAFIIWRIGQNIVLNLENEGYQTDTLKERLDIIFETVAFFVHICDRLAYEEEMDEEERGKYITEMVMHSVRQIKNNLREIEGIDGEEATRIYIDLFNQRMADYAEFPFENSEPGFNFKRYYGEKVAACMGPRDNKWIQQQVMDIEVPDALKTLKKSLTNLFASDEELLGNVPKGTNYDA